MTTGKGNPEHQKGQDMERTKATNYLVEDHTKQGKVFATLEEANAYANYCIRNSGYVWRVIETDREVTHTYDIEKQ